MVVLTTVKFYSFQVRAIGCLNGRAAMMSLPHMCTGATIGPLKCAIHYERSVHTVYIQEIFTVPTGTSYYRLTCRYKWKSGVYYPFNG